MAGERAGSGAFVQYALDGTLRQDDALGSGIGEFATIPEDLVAAGERLYRAGEAFPDHGIRVGDVLVVELRANGTAATGELVLATVGTRVFLGRWWGKHGRRAVMDGDLAVLTEDTALVVLGAVTVIVRTGQ